MVAYATCGYLNRLEAYATLINRLEAYATLKHPKTMKKDLLLAIDVGTGSVRAALITLSGETVAFSAQEHDQIVPQFGWSEQHPESWWEGAVTTVRAVLGKIAQASGRVAGVAACGQMHGTVLIDDDGRLVMDRIPLWNDKRTREVVEEFQRAHDTKRLLPIVGNPPTVAFAAFKLVWIKRHEPRAYEAARTLLMPKDYINFRLTGVRAIDFSEASCNYLLDIRKRAWSEEVVNLLDLDSKKLPPLKDASDVLGTITRDAASETGLWEGTPVTVGAGDYPVTLLGSGVIRSGMGSDVTGTSTLITLMTAEPVLDPVITNVKGVAGGWGAFTILDAGGDAMRWARRAFHENQYSYDRIVELASAAPALSSLSQWRTARQASQLAGPVRRPHQRSFCRSFAPRRDGGRCIRFPAQHGNNEIKRQLSRAIGRSRRGRQDQALAGDQSQHLRLPDSNPSRCGMRGTWLCDARRRRRRNI
jgi:sugar (pentulose or hexulose) kinase